MKKIIFLAFVFLLAGCASSSKSASRLNCEKLHIDSQSKLEELQQIFSAYQNINYDLAVTLSPPLKEQVEQLDSRVRKQKQRCWAKEKRPIDSDMALLKEELFKVYGGDEPKKMRLPASQPAKVIQAEEVEEIE